MNAPGNEFGPPLRKRRNRRCSLERLPLSRNAQAFPEKSLQEVQQTIINHILIGKKVSMSPKAKNTESVVADTTVVTDSNKAEYGARLPEIIEQKVGSSTVSTKMAVVLNAVGERLYRRARQDKDLLTAAGLPEESFIKLKEAAGASRYAEAELKLAREFRSQWNIESPKGYALVLTIKQALLYALEDKPDLLKIVRRIAKGTSRAAMVQQLQDYSTFGKAHKKRLREIGFDTSLLDKAADLSAYLANLLGASGNDATAGARIIRDKSFFYLKDIIMTIRTCGQYVFRNDPQRLAEYSGVLLPKKGGRRKTTTFGETQVPAVSRVA